MNEKHFTVIELMVVVAITAILAAIIVPAIAKHRVAQKAETAKVEDYQLTKLFEVEDSAVYSYVIPFEGKRYILVPLKHPVLEKPESR